jgi:hypothetical protein
LQGERYKDKFLIEEIWTDDQLVVIGNGQVLLRRQPNPYWHGKKPIVIAQTRPDLFEMVGVSETELVDDLQQALHTSEHADRQPAFDGDARHHVPRRRRHRPEHARAPAAVQVAGVRP